MKASFEFRNKLNYQCQSTLDIVLHIKNTIQFCTHYSNNIIGTISLCEHLQKYRTLGTPEIAFLPRLQCSHISQDESNIHIVNICKYANIVE